MFLWEVNVKLVDALIVIYKSDFKGNYDRCDF